MVRNSIQYRSLCSRINKLEELYLPTHDEPLHKYTKREEDDIRAYSLLVHAELESYFETMSQAKAQKALSLWRKNHKYHSHVLLSLSCFVEQTQKVKDEKTLELKLRKIVGVFCETIKNNNGIKEQNIKNLLLPIGIEEKDLDSTWLNTLNSFGATRGQIAHTGASVTKVPNHDDIKNDVKHILLILKDLDIVIKSLR